jgi:hypothetical protein
VVLIHTFCSSVAAIVAIAVHRRNISGEFKLAVWSMNDSIQDSSRLLPLSFVVPIVAFESIGVFVSIKVTFIPPYFTIIWNPKNSVVRQWHIND